MPELPERKPVGNVYQEYKAYPARMNPIGFDEFARLDHLANAANHDRQTQACKDHLKRQQEFKWFHVSTNALD